LERASASPGSILALMRANYEIDVRHLLPSVRVPTLILHRTGDALIPVAAGRYLAEHIPGAKYVEIPGTDHMVLDQETQDIIADEIEEFITGSRRHLEPVRVLATIMFTDIVSSTQRVAEVGDARWRELLGNFYALLRRELTAFRGHEVRTAGDGLLATFDGPARAIRCACSMREKIRPLGLQVRTGLHTGECELIEDDIGGIAVHIAARVAALAESDRLQRLLRNLLHGRRVAVGLELQLLRLARPVSRETGNRLDLLALDVAGLLARSVRRLDPRHAHAAGKRPLPGIEQHLVDG